MQKIGGWNRDRSTNEEGLTLAGLLMFGKFNSIREACPFYFVDYQEKSSMSPIVVGPN
jgi:ATP-dependent DNA helicase RecG